MQDHKNYELDDLLSQCLKLASAEKITAKNSWDLQLIDQLDELVDTEQCDFVRASGAIQASTKIYSGRVDKLFQDCAQIANLTGIKEEEDTEAVSKRGKRRPTRNAHIDTPAAQL